MEIQNNKHLHEDYNIVIKLTTNCPANCKCCSNRKREIKNKNEDNSIFEISYFDKICKNIKKNWWFFYMLKRWRTDYCKKYK